MRDANVLITGVFIDHGSAYELADYQKMIDDAAAEGSSSVTLPQGRYFCYPLDAIIPQNFTIDGHLGARFVGKSPHS